MAAPKVGTGAAGRRGLYAASAGVCIAFSVLAGVSWWLALAGFAVLAFAISLTAVRPQNVHRLSNASTTRARRDLDARSANLIAALPDPCIVVNRRSVVVMHNAQAAAVLSGLRVGDPLAFVLRVPAVTEALRSVLAGGSTQILNYQERVPVEQSFEVHIVPVRIEATAEEGPDYVVITLHDETKRERLEAMRVDFVANASHELRTPLASLLGFIETLQGPARNDLPARERFLAIMREQALRMSRLIDDLLSLSQIELNAHVRPQNIINLTPILSQTVDALTPLAKENKTKLRLEGAGEAYYLRGQRDEIYRVAENLIENAIKYGGADRTVTTRLFREAEHDGFPQAIGFSVADQGPGIPPEHLPRLTERFYRVDTESSRSKGGTGLGLAIVKHILARHRGRLAITSTPGEGSVFAARFDEVIGEAGEQCHPIVKEAS